MRLLRQLFGWSEREARNLVESGPVLEELPDGELPSELVAAIESASFVERSEDEEGRRFATFAPGLGGCFIYDRGVLETRIRNRFPHLSDRMVDRACTYMHNHFNLFLRQQKHVERERKSWVHGWGYQED